MAERSKAPDSRDETLSNCGAFWSTIVGVGSNPTSDTSIYERKELQFNYNNKLVQLWNLPFLYT